MYSTPELGVPPADKDINVVVECLSEMIVDTFVWRAIDGSYQSRGFSSLKEASADADIQGFIYREPGTYGSQDRYVCPESVLGLF